MAVPRIKILPLNDVVPEKDQSRRWVMHKGTMIDELIAAVARAEAHARTAEPVEGKPQPVLAPPVYPELVRQTPFIAAVMGAA